MDPCERVTLMYQSYFNFSGHGIDGAKQTSVRFADLPRLIWVR